LEHVYIFYGHLEYLQAFGIFYDHLVHFVFIWYMYPVLLYCVKKNLAALIYMLGASFCQKNTECILKGDARENFSAEKNGFTILRFCHSYKRPMPKLFIRHPEGPPSVYKAIM
jgi:hypothetical protein